MDLSDINKMDNSKRINADAERLKEKVTRETANIIKLKVAQDTAVSEAREQRDESERARERMQRDVLDVHLENERLAARLKDELRLRPDTLNKVDTAHKLSDEMERNMERTRAAMRRAAADRVELEAAYARAAATVDAAAGEARARNQRLTQAAARAAAEAAGARAQLAAAAAEAERELARRDTLLLDAERVAAALRDELEHGAREAVALRAALGVAEARAAEEERRRREREEERDALQKERDNLSLEKEKLQKELLRAHVAVKRLMRELHERAVRSEEKAPPAAPRGPPGHQERAPPAPAPEEEAPGAGRRAGTLVRVPSPRRSEAVPRAGTLVRMPRAGTMVCVKNAKRPRADSPLL